MVHKLIEHIQQWFELGMPLGGHPAEIPIAGDGLLLEASQEDNTAYCVVSHQNVYHPSQKDALLLRSGQTVSNTLLQKLTQFGIDVAKICSLHERQTGTLHPITAETLAWLPNNQAILQSTVGMMGLPNKAVLLNESLHTTACAAMNASRGRFEETLLALKACPLPNVLVLNPQVKEQRKFGKLLEAIGIEYQQIRPVFMLETLPYVLRKYRPHTLIIDEACWQRTAIPTDQAGIAHTVLWEEQKVAMVERFVTELSRVLQASITGRQREADSFNNLPPTVLLVLNPHMPYKQAILKVLSRLDRVVTLTILWKPCKRLAVSEALKNFRHLTHGQLERRQASRLFVR